MKKILAFILSLGLIMSLTACGNETITMQDVFDAYQLDAMLDSHDSVYIRTQENGEVCAESYFNAEFSYDRYGEVAVYMTDSSCYFYSDGVYYQVVYIEPDGLVDMASHRAEYFASPILTPLTLQEDIQSVTQQGNCITVASVMDLEKLEEQGEMEEGLLSGSFEYVLDAETGSPVKSTSAYSYDDGTVFESTNEYFYNAEIPEEINAFLEIDHQTEDLRTITVVFHPENGAERTVSLQAPKGLVFGLSTTSGTVDEYGMYADAACTEPFVASGDFMFDATVHVKWLE